MIRWPVAGSAWWRDDLASWLQATFRKSGRAAAHQIEPASGHSSQPSLMGTIQRYVVDGSFLPVEQPGESGAH
jgi:hypothetical protein